MAAMDRVDLANLYTTGDFADCAFVSSSGEEFPAHRFVFSQFSRLKEFVAEGGRIHLPEPTEVVERLLRWVYGVEWVNPDNVQPTRVGVGKELSDIMALCEAAENYEIPKLVDDAHAAAGRVLEQINSSAVTLRVLKDLTEKDSAAGMLQRIVVDRALLLQPKEDAARHGGTKRSREDDVEETSAGAADEGGYADIVRVPKRSARTPKPSARAKESPPTKKRGRKSTPAKKERKSTGPKRKPEKQTSSFQLLQQDTQSTPDLYCVCNKPEDPYLVECENCGRWFHPGCIGKGKCTGRTHNLKSRHFARERDEKWYRDENLSFSCTECDDKLA